MVSYGIIFVDDDALIENIEIQINQEIKFVNVNTWKVYEQYTFNKKKIQRQLGVFNGSFDYFPIAQLALESRRGDLNGYQLKGMTESIPAYLSIDLSAATFDNISQTYDVTESVSGMFYDIFLEVKDYLNFTFTLHKRKDGEWGPTKVLENGTVIAAGIVSSVTSGFADMCVAR